MLRKPKCYFIALVIFPLLTSCHSSIRKDYLFDATQLTYEITPEKLIRIMGQKPDSAFNKTLIGKKRYILLYFNRDSSEFRFDKNRLLEVIVNKPQFPFAAQTITEFGLPFQNPSKTDTTAFIEWRNVYKNFDIINFYLVGDKRDNRSVHYKIYFKPGK